MKKTINRHEFIESMKAYYDGNGFSDEGLYKLYDYLENYESETGEEIELDVVALHCQYSEYNVIDFINEYYDDEDIEAILSANRLDSVEEITADMIQEYERSSANEWSSANNRVVAKVNDNTIIIDAER